MTLKIAKTSKMRLILPLLIGLTLSGPIAAKTSEDFQTWGNITATGSLGVINPHLKNYKYWLEGQGRFGEDTSRFSQGMLRTGLGYALNDNTSLWLGYAFIPTDEPFAATPFDEHRIWQQLLWSEKFSFGTLTSRSRFEQRFVQTGEDVGWRFRQLLKLSTPLPYATDFSLVLTDEYFANINRTDWNADDGFDQNRVFAGLGYNFDKNTRTEIGYMNQYIRKAAAPDRMSHILSVNLYLNY
jgi:opacity protein-like surface antigen